MRQFIWASIFSIALLCVAFFASGQIAPQNPNNNNLNFVNSGGSGDYDYEDNYGSGGGAYVPGYANLPGNIVWNYIPNYCRRGFSLCICILLIISYRDIVRAFLDFEINFEV